MSHKRDITVYDYIHINNQDTFYEDKSNIRKMLFDQAEKEQIEFPKPPRIYDPYYKKNDLGIPDLEWYDNEDGYWDDWI